MKTLQNLDNLRRLRQQIEICDDFDWYVTAHRWTSLAADSGASVALTDAVGGILAITTGNTDNNEAAIISTNEIFKFGADAPLVLETEIQFTDLTAADGGVFWGLSDSAGADTLANNTGVPSISNTGVCIFKACGSSVWSVYSKNGATATTTASTTTAGGSAYQNLRIEAYAVDGTNIELIFFCNDSPLRDSNNRPIKHRLPFASATEMHLALYGKTGTTESLVINSDFVYAAQRR